MHIHQLLDHPLFEEQDLRTVLEPFGFEVNIESDEPPIDPACDDPDAIDAYADEPEAYIDSLCFTHPAGFTEVTRHETEDGDIISVSVRAKTVFAQLLLCADSAFAGPSSPIAPSYIDVYRERMRQLSTKGFSRERDDGYQQGELARAAVSYVRYAWDDGAHHAALRYRDAGAAPAEWPWPPKTWKPSEDRRRNLVKAGALILAEIERLDRADTKLSEGDIPFDASGAGGEG